MPYIFEFGRLWGINCIIGNNTKKFDLAIRVREHKVSRISSTHVFAELASRAAGLRFWIPQIAPTNLLLKCLLVIYPPKSLHVCIPSNPLYSLSSVRSMSEQGF